MFYKYEIIKSPNGDILYLYTTAKYEYSNELDLNEDNISILSRNYIKMNNIPYKGNIIYLVIDGLVTKKIDISKNKNISDTFYSPDLFLINLKLEDGSLSEMTLREYLTSILINITSYNLGDEVLKAICVLYNTYAFKMMSENNYILENNNFYNYCNYKELKNIISDYNSIIIRINKIIDSCQGMFLCYNGSFILPFIHYSNSGKTLSNHKYSYLTSVKSLWDLTSPYYINSRKLSYLEINNLLGTNLSDKSNVTIQHNGNEIKLGDKRFNVLEIKRLLNLTSNDLSIIINNNSIVFITKGLGNGYGLSMFGSKAIEENGGKFHNILNYYYPKCKLFQYTKKFS